MSNSTSSSKQIAAFYFSVFGLTLAIWPLGFELGAYKTVLMDHLLAIWFVSVAALLAQLFVGSPKRRSKLVRLLTLALLILPSAWLLSEILLLGYDQFWAVALKLTLMIAAVALALPYLVFMLIVVALPQIFELKEPQHLARLMIITLAIFALACVAGYFHAYLLTCGDFKIAGHFVPDQCWTGELE